MLACCLLMAACNASSDAASGGDASHRPLPAISATLSWERLDGGSNRVREAYATYIDSCRQAGFPTRELAPDEVDKLGHGQVDIRIDDRHQHVRQTRWEFEQDSASAGPAGCAARLVAHQDEADGSTDPADGMFLPTEATPPEHDEGGWRYLGTGQVRGQACKRWQKQDQEVCIWSGGTEWGFGDGPLDVAGCAVDSAGSYFSAIPLEGNPLAGNGCKLMLQAFTIGKGPLPPEPAKPRGN